MFNGQLLLSPSREHNGEKNPLLVDFIPDEDAKTKTAMWFSKVSFYLFIYHIIIKGIECSASRVFLDDNRKRYDVGEHEKSVERKRGKAKFSLCFLSVLHVIAFYIIV